MKSTSLGLALIASQISGTVAYSLKDDYFSDNFFDQFSFWTSDDPTKGYVDYLSQSDANNGGLIKQGSQVFIGVDNNTVVSDDSRGRGSVRLTSNADYEVNTLIVADIAHMPGGMCGAWPAFWTTAVTDNWPDDGEIDIVEEITTSNSNQMSLHVSDSQGSCNIASQTSMTADPDRWGDCTEENTGGCDANDPRDTSFGKGFNDNGGGVYAMEWTDDHVRVYFFPRDSIPDGDSGPLGSSPDPSSWGTPTTAFEGGDCNLDDHIKSQHIIIDTTFCGSWAGDSDWSGYTGCSQSTGVDTCESYVGQTPDAFDEAYWMFNSLKTYT